MEFRTERINEDNIKDLVFLMVSVHGKSKGIDYYKKKFDTRYCGVCHIGYFAYAADGTPAAFYGVFPTVFSNNGQRILMCQSGDTITNPKYQKRGLFVMLANLTYDLAAKNGIGIVFGFPNANSSHGFFNKLGWTNEGHFWSSTVSYQNLSFYSAACRLKMRGVYLLFFRVLHSCFLSGKINNLRQNNNVFTQDISADYLSYKKFEDSYVIKFSRYNFWIKFEDGIKIGYIEFLATPDKSHLLATLKRLAFLLGVKKITVLFSEKSLLYSLWGEKPGIQKNIEIGYKVFDKAYAKYSLDFSYSDFDTF